MPLPPPQIPPRRTLPTWAAGVLTVMAFVGLLILGRLAWALTEPIPIVAAETSQTTSAGVSSGLAIDPTLSAALIQAANAQATFMAPTPTPIPPTPTYAALPTVPPLVCGRDSVRGQLCEWAVPTATATPGPAPCVTPVGGESCLWQGWPRVTTDDS